MRVYVEINRTHKFKVMELYIIYLWKSWVQSLYRQKMVNQSQIFSPDRIIHKMQEQPQHLLSVPKRICWQLTN